MSEASSEGVVKLQRFKSYVHARLDTAGVSADPESPHKAQGCRIGGRLDELIGERDELRAVAKAYERWEADLLLCHEAWDGRDLPHFTQSLWDRLVEIQTMRNAAVAKAKGER